jgi:uncharacterized protein YndB with AHSA1/START domain
MTDRIEKRVTLKAPVARVWRAIVDSAEFGKWFGIALEGEFAEGHAIRGSFSHLQDESEIIAYQKDAGIDPAPIKRPEQNSVFCTVERMEPERYFSFRWIPYGIDVAADPESEPMTLVEFRLETVPEGTLLSIVESGFERVPAHRRERAYRMNDGGWARQLENIARYVEGS